MPPPPTPVVGVAAATELYTYEVVSDAGGSAMSMPAAVPNVPALVGKIDIAQGVFLETLVELKCTSSPLGVVTSKGLLISIVQ
jgi:hypothetical protein